MLSGARTKPSVSTARQSSGCTPSSWGCQALGPTSLAREGDAEPVATPTPAPAACWEGTEEVTSGLGQAVNWFQALKALLGPEGTQHTLAK